MEFNLRVVDVTGEEPNVVKFEGDVEAVLEIPLSRIGVKLDKGDAVRLVLSREKDADFKKYRVYMWGTVYYIGDGVTRISIGGLQLDIMRELPLKVGEKVYIGLL
ncbi:MAG: hypothetical protein QW598_07565 [Pyrobaculum sp.]